MRLSCKIACPRHWLHQLKVKITFARQSEDREINKGGISKLGLHLWGMLNMTIDYLNIIYSIIILTPPISGVYFQNKYSASFFRFVVNIDYQHILDNLRKISCVKCFF